MTTCYDLPLNDLALLGLKETMRCYWFDINALGLISMLSVRARQVAASNDFKYWRAAVREMFPQHPFEVNASVDVNGYMDG